MEWPLSWGITVIQQGPKMHHIAITFRTKTSQSLTGVFSLFEVSTCSLVRFQRTQIKSCYQSFLLIADLSASLETGRAMKHQVNILLFTPSSYFSLSLSPPLPFLFLSVFSHKTALVSMLSIPSNATYNWVWFSWRNNNIVLCPTKDRHSS